MAEIIAVRSLMHLLLHTEKNIFPIKKTPKTNLYILVSLNP